VTDASPPRIGLKDVITLGASIIGAAFIVGGALRADGGRDAKTEDNTRRIEILERKDLSKDDLLTKIDGRTIRIETKLEMMAPAKNDAR
jgi:hypothetical protein